MKLYLKIPVLGLALSMMLSSFTALADPPTGTYMIQFNDPTVRIWDPTGNYTESFDTSGDDWDVFYTLNVDGGGNLTGSGTFLIDSCGLGACIDLDGDFIITGKMSSSGDTVRFQMNFDMFGQGEFQGFDLFFFAKMKVAAELDTLSSVMVGSVSGSVKVEVPGEGKGGAKVPRSEFYATMPAGSDGAWTLVLNLQQPIPEKPEQLAGNAMIELSSGVTLDLDAVKGKYNAKTDATTVALKPLKNQIESKGVSLKLQSMPGGGFDLKAAKGKVAKQKVAWDNSQMLLQSSGETYHGAISSFDPYQPIAPDLPLP